MGTCLATLAPWSGSERDRRVAPALPNYDTRHQWAWIGCFLGLIALMRTEIKYEDAHPGYKSPRHKFRLVMGFLFMTYMTSTTSVTPSSSAPSSA